MRKFFIAISLITFLITIMATTGCNKKGAGSDSPTNKNETVAEIKTNKGDITVVLYTDKTPETAKNFIELAKEGKYDNTTFHRVIDGFMIQGGDFENHNGTGGHSYKGPGTYLKEEIVKGLSHKRGVLSMANRGPNTGGSQFFIVQGKSGATWLDGAHTVFGHVEEGMDVVDAIAGAQVDGSDVPLEKMVIEKIEIK
jgi:cyclophilin family peptidyl-prolyl cis-trans isomerase